jgi:AcrR family transcriptional regulator
MQDQIRANFIPEANPTGHRATKKRRQREQLIKIGLELFFQYGFEKTSIAKIAQDAGISERTFFHYFKTKEELVFDWNNANGRFCVEVLHKQKPDQPAIKSLRIMFQALADRIETDYKRSVQISQLIFGSPTLSARSHDEFNKWERHFLQALKRDRGKVKTEETYRLEIEVSVAVHAFTTAVRQWSLNHTVGNRSIRPWVLRAFDVIYKTGQAGHT